MCADREAIERADIVCEGLLISVIIFGNIKRLGNCQAVFFIYPLSVLFNCSLFLLAPVIVIIKPAKSIISPAVIAPPPQVASLPATTVAGKQKEAAATPTKRNKIPTTNNIIPKVNNVFLPFLFINFFFSFFIFLNTFFSFLFFGIYVSILFLLLEAVAPFIFPEKINNTNNNKIWILLLAAKQLSLFISN
ncbi:MAG TPA: hypothetical protein ENJ95_07760 [Bacteroidetes bacterium]|nr:hypothetical protein [Bacteroidota bacterium]